MHPPGGPIMTTVGQTPWRYQCPRHRGRACSTLPGRITSPQAGSSMLDPYGCPHEQQALAIPGGATALKLASCQCEEKAAPVPARRQGCRPHTVAVLLFLITNAASAA